MTRFSMPTSGRGAIGSGLLAALVALLCVLVVSGCGSSPSASSTTSSTSSTTTTGTSTTSGSFTAYQNCLKAHGVTFARGAGGPGGGPGGQGGTPPATPGGSRPSFTAAQQKALTACASLRPSGGFGGGAGGGRGGFGGAGGAGGGGANSAAFTKFQACLKSHGVQTGAPGQNSAKAQAAITACRSLLPNGGAGTGATTTTTPAQ
jgi:hypothetical protein